ncbi:hypothetical protein EJ02DRAFT_428514 [Clathrospora elynae]|uniref:Uncharacterized protein n=1 Tax=Clathrospora elynae TaxID=706981 RepID=A0A6A5S7G5_9PLEO|nr:hypothetical protein EJ02DRAFT_428514 [Clathrospora elynae]
MGFHEVLWASPPLPPLPHTHQTSHATRTIEAASTASQTQIWEQMVKNSLASPPLPPLLHHNDSYP